MTLEPCGQTDTTENITFLETTCAGGNIQLILVTVLFIN